MIYQVKFGHCFTEQWPFFYYEEKYSNQHRAKLPAMTSITISAIFGGIDNPINQGITQYNELNTPWPMHNLESRLRGKAFKMLSHRIHDEDVHIWIDGNVKILPAVIQDGVIVKPSFQDFILSHFTPNTDIVIQRHPQRSTIYEEADYICNRIEVKNQYLRKRYAPKAIRKEIELIAPGVEGLYACGIFARRNTAKVNAAFEEWYMMSHLYANFDQIMFVYIAQKFGLNITTIDFGNFYKNEYYELIKHSKVQ